MNSITNYPTYYQPSATDTLLSEAGTSAADLGIWGIIAALLAIIGGVLVYFLFVKAPAKPKGKFACWLKDFLSFKIMWVEAILKVLYYISTIFVILVSFGAISSSFLAFILILVGGPIIIRLIYEAMLMFIMIWRNTTDIAKNTSKDKK